MPAPLHNDLPTLDDRLGWNDEIERLKARILDCPTPHVLGVHGDWGSGKTSFMRQLQERLGGEMPKDNSVWPVRDNVIPHDDKKKLQKRVVTVWFDAWRYQNEPVPVVALLQEMRRQMALVPAIKAKLAKLTGISLRYALNGLSEIGKVIGIEGISSAEKIEALGEKREQEHYAQGLEADSIRTHLHATIKYLLPADDARLVVFIDDLDRCNPKAAVRLLEGLKLYLTLPDCIFVLGMNERILADAIGEEIPAPKDTPTAVRSIRASHYLEKICTDIHRLPLPVEPTELLAGWLPEKSDDEKTQKAALREAVSHIRCLPPNPRRLKALANQWARFAARVDFPADDDARHAWAVRVLIATYVHQFHRDLWERWHFNADFWDECRAWCNGERSFNADGTPVPPPQWAAGLKLTETKALGSEWKSDFPNPGDIDLFWMDGLIREYRDDLTSADISPLLRAPA